MGLDNFLGRYNKTLGGMDIVAVFRRAKLVEVPAGELVICEGDLERSMYLIDRGDVEIYEVSEDGTEIIYNVLGPGELFGEVGLVDGQPRTRSVRARSDCVFWRVDRSDLERLPARDKIAFYKFIAILLAYRFRMVVGRDDPALSEASASAEPLGLSRLPGADAWECRGRRVRSALEAIREPVEAIKDGFYRLHRRSSRQQTISEEEVGRLMQKLDGLFEEVCPEIEEAFGRDSERAEEEMREIGRFVRRELYPYLMRSHLMERLYLKPRGVPYDYMTQEHVYQSRPRGEGPLGVLMDKWLLQTSMFKALRGRRDWLRRQLEREGRRLYLEDPNGVRAIDILVIGLGSGRGLFDFVNESRFSEQLTLTCIDLDIEALSYVNNQVNSSQHYAAVRLIRDSVNQFIREDGAYYTSKDIIYTITQPDFLDDETLGALIARCRKLLRPGGVLHLANLSRQSGQRALVSSMFDLSIHPRGCDEMEALLQERFGGGAFAVDMTPDRSDLRVTARCAVGG